MSGVSVSMFWVRQAGCVLDIDPCWLFALWDGSGGRAAPGNLQTRSWWDMPQEVSEGCPLLEVAGHHVADGSLSCLAGWWEPLCVGLRPAPSPGCGQRLPFGSTLLGQFWVFRFNSCNLRGLGGQTEWPSDMQTQKRFSLAGEELGPSLACQSP